MLKILKGSAPLALALLVARASGQSVYASAGYYTNATAQQARGSDPRQSYRAESVHDYYGEYFERSYAEASYRSIKLKASVEGATFAYASASIVDRFSLSSLTAGTHWGVFFAKVRAHGDALVDAAYAPLIGGNGYGRSEFDFSLRFNPVGSNDGTKFTLSKKLQDSYLFEPSIDKKSAQWFAYDPIVGGVSQSYDPDAGEYTLPFFFEFDESYEMRTSVSAVAYTNDGASTATVDFGNTYLFRGIESVYALHDDGTRTQIMDYTIHSLSGVDYTQPVPEPATLVALGAGALGLLRRRAR